MHPRVLREQLHRLSSIPAKNMEQRLSEAFSKLLKGKKCVGSS